MSGHSKWSTIKHQKAVKDSQRGKLFSKLARGVLIASKEGGPDPSTNYKLRVAMDAARAANMPKANIERAISKGEEADNLEELTYEGFGPSGVSVIVEVATDNRNRTGQEIKGIFEKAGGRLAGPGAVSFNFAPKGFLLIKKTQKVEDQILSLIDAGVEDAEEVKEGIEVYVPASDLKAMREKIEEEGFKAISAELVQKPKSYQAVENAEKVKKIISFLEKLEDNDDVQKVFANVDIDDKLLEKINSGGVN